MQTCGYVKLITLDCVFMVLFPLEKGFGEPWFPNFVW